MQRDVCDTPRRVEADIFIISELLGLFTKPDPQTGDLIMEIICIFTILTFTVAEDKYFHGSI